MPKRFLFDNHDFDQLAEARSIPVEERPQFSQLDMEAAVSGAQQRGFEEGLANAVQGEEARIARLLEKLGGEMMRLQEAEQVRNAEAQGMAIEIASGLLRKLMPELSQQPSLEGVSSLVSKVMMDRFEEPRLIIRVHDNILDGLNDRLKSLAQQAGFRGQYALMADTSLAPTDCRIEWSNGGVERSVSRLWDNMQLTLAQIHASLGGDDSQQDHPELPQAPADEVGLEVMEEVEILPEEIPNESESEPS